MSAGTSLKALVRRVLTVNSGDSAAVWSIQATTEPDLVVTPTSIRPSPSMSNTKGVGLCRTAHMQPREGEWCHAFRCTMALGTAQRCDPGTHETVDCEESTTCHCLRHVGCVPLPMLRKKAHVCESPSVDPRTTSSSPSLLRRRTAPATTQCCGGVTYGNTHAHTRTHAHAHTHAHTHNQF